MILRKLIQEYPFVTNFLEMNELDISGHENLTFHDYLNTISDEILEEKAIDRDTLEENLSSFIREMLNFLGENKVESLTIIAGINKSREKENFEKLEIKKSQIISIVGPTGSGKSRLLSDIEFMAQKDTPTKRQILINGEIPNSSKRFSTQEKLVAQLSQNMNFVMDLTVKEFLELHCKARLVDPKEKLEKIIKDANKLAGEKFNLDTFITELSGGQSRALMISDTANLSKSPIVLIDEIENAGIDRREAIKLLISEEKIVLMATHDPTLALMADMRIVIKNGGIEKIIKTEDRERKILNELEKIDKYVGDLRENLRRGNSLV